MGPRRVGKTVMIHHLIERLLGQGVPARNLCYFSVDHPIYNGLGLEDCLKLHQAATSVDAAKEECFAFFDEIQYLRDWEKHLKALVDTHPTLRCLVSGSAAAALRLKSSESGAGRFTDFLLPPLSFHEYLFLKQRTDLVVHRVEGGQDLWEAENLGVLNEHFVDYLNYGGYPEVVFSDVIRADPGRYIKSDIIDKVLLRDLPSLYGIQDIKELNYLFTTLAFNTAGEVSLEGLSKGSGVAKNTIKKYVEYLEAAFLIRAVHRVDKSAKRFKRANYFKVYLTNPSMRAALFSPVSSDDPAMGALVETAVYAQWFHQSMPLYYARWNGGEVDIVALDANLGASWAVETKWSDRYFERPEELTSLLSFCRAQRLHKGMVTTRSKSGERAIAGCRLEFTPASLYCYLLGYNIVESKQSRAETS
jgi:hypothetical protein